MMIKILLKNKKIYPAFFYILYNKMKITKIIKNIKNHKYIIIFICLITLLSVCLVCFSKKRQAKQELEIEKFTNPGEVYATGWNKYGQLGLGDTTNRLTFTNGSSWSPCSVRQSS